MSVHSYKTPLVKNSLRSLTFVGVLLIASNLRAPITALGPVIHEISASFSLSNSASGLLNALPLLIFGLASPFAPRLTRKVGLEKALLTALILITVGCIVRSLMGLPGLWLGTFIIGLGIAIANVLVVPLVKRDFPSHTALGLLCSLFITVGIAGILIMPGLAAIWLVFAGVGAGMSMVTIFNQIKHFVILHCQGF